MTAERRCPVCGALASEDARWCGLCYTPFAPYEARSSGDRSSARTDVGGKASGTVTAIHARDGEPSWPCPVCEHVNPIELSTCAACGTPFARLFQEPEPAPDLGPQMAFGWSMVFPGVGHWKLRRRADAIARFVLGGWLVATVVVLVVSRFGKGGLGPTASLFLLFLAALIALWLVSALDAYRIASGEPPVATSRALLWAFVALIVLSVVLATLVALPAARGA